MLKRFAVTLVLSVPLLSCSPGDQARQPSPESHAQVGALQDQRPSVQAQEAEVASINHAISKKGLRWTAGKTSMTELSPAERAKRLGVKVDSANVQTSPAAAPSSKEAAMKVSANLPSFPVPPLAIDYRSDHGNNYVTPIRDQGACGSCWAFASTAALESHISIYQNASMNLSEQVLLSCSGVGSCSGGDPLQAATFLTTTGIPDDSYYPYVMANGACADAGAGWQNHTQKAADWVAIPQTINSLENALATYGPISVSMNVLSDFYSYTSGVYSYTQGNMMGGHQIELIGYDHINHYFIAKNSWGTLWGEQGFLKIDYSEVDGHSSFGNLGNAFYHPDAAPTLLILGPMAYVDKITGVQYQPGSTRRIEWQYNGKVGAVKIELVKGGVFHSVISESAFTGYKKGTGFFLWNLPTSLVPADDYQIRVTEVANPSRTSTSPAFSIVRDAQAPFAEITTPSEGATVSGIVNLKATVRDDVGLSKAEFYVDNQFLGAGTLDIYTQSASLDWDTSKLQNGSHTFEVRTVDFGGNWTYSRSSAQVSNTNPTPSPLPTATPAPACMVSNPTVTIAAITPSGIPGSKVKYSTIVKNNDTPGCAPRAFQLSASGGWDDGHSSGGVAWSDLNDIVTLAPGAATPSKEFTLNIIPTASVGTYFAQVSCTVGLQRGIARTDLFVAAPTPNPTPTQGSEHWGTAGDIPIPDFYYYPGKIWLGVFRPSTGMVYLRDAVEGYSYTFKWGTSGDIPIAGDFLDLGHAQVAQFRPSDGNWYIMDPSTLATKVIHFGTSGDIPFTGDFFGNGGSNLGVFRPSTGVIYVMNIVSGEVLSASWGISTDKPVVGDFLGLRRSQIAQFRASTGTWWILDMKTQNYSAQQWGTAGDIPLAGRFLNQGRHQMAVFRPSDGGFFIKDAVTGEMRFLSWGKAGDIPLAGDFMHLGSDQVTQFRPSDGNWYMLGKL